MGERERERGKVCKCTMTLLLKVLNKSGLPGCTYMKTVENQIWGTTSMR